MPIKTAAIIGAGIAGLTTALALARHGIRSEIFEQAEALTEVGAGLQISPNASRILDTLGVLDTLRAVWLEPEGCGLSRPPRCDPSHPSRAEISPENDGARPTVRHIAPRCRRCFWKP